MANLLCPAHDSSNGITVSERRSSERGSGPGGRSAGVTLLSSVNVSLCVVWIYFRGHVASLEKWAPLALTDCQERMDHLE